MSQLDTLDPLLRAIIDMPAEMRGPTLDLVRKLTGDGRVPNRRQLLRFLRREQCWSPADSVHKPQPEDLACALRVVEAIKMPGRYCIFDIRERFFGEKSHDAPKTTRSKANFLNAFIGKDEDKLIEPPKAFLYDLYLCEFAEDVPHDWFPYLFAESHQEGLDKARIDFADLIHILEEQAHGKPGRLGIGGGGFKNMTTCLIQGLGGQTYQVGSFYDPRESFDSWFLYTEHVSRRLETRAGQRFIAGSKPRFAAV